MKMKRISRQILSFTVVLAMLVLSLFTGCAGQGSQSSQSSQTTSTSGTTEILAEADIPAVESSQFENSAKLDLDNRLAYPHYKTVVSLYAANGPGQPKNQKVSNLYASSGDVQISGPQLASVTAPFTFLNPVAGEVLYVNSPYEISWTSRMADRMPKLNILLSTDGGVTFEEIVTQMDYASSCSIYVLNRPSSRCFFRIDAYIGETVYSTTSPQFTIARKAAPTPTPAPSPSPTPTIAPTPTPVVLPTPTPAPDLAYSKTTIPFIDQNGDATRWFFLDLQTTKAAKIIWQLSKTPFAGLSTSDYLNPPGLIASGELPVQGDEFAVDFNAIYQSLQANYTSEKTATQSNYVPIAATNRGVEFAVPAKQVMLEQLQYALYMRAIALDAQGRCIGDPGEGIELFYGRQAIDFSPDRNSILQQALGGIQTWVRPLSGMSGAPFEHLVAKGLAAKPTDQAFDFEFRSTPEGTVSVELQVATSPFASGTAAIENPAGLVHRVTWGPEFSYPPNAFTTSIRFADFAPKAEELGTDAIKYYVRMIFYRPSKVTAGTLYPTVSEVQPVYYAKSFVSDYQDQLTAMPTRPTNQVIVDSDIPYTKFLRYVPVQWEDPDANHYFEVTRRIMANEVCFSLTNKVTGETLNTFSAERFVNPTLTTEQYQAKVDRMLPVGSTFHLTVTQSLWNEFWSLLSDIYESIRTAYDNLKVTMVAYIVKYIPVDDDIKKILSSALETALTTGLAAIGIPPTLPNFEALVGDGFEYCLEVAIEEACKTAGIPENQISQVVRDQIADQLRQQMGSISQMNQANPLDVDFLKPSTKHHYRPAYVEVSVANYSDDPSPAGTLKISYYPVKTDFMDIYKSKSMPIPSLDPGQHMIIRVYLKEDIPEAYSSGKSDYDVFYWGNGGDCIFTLKAIYNLPDVRQAAAEQNLTAQTSPFLTNEYVYDHDPIYEYTMTWVPSEIQLAMDESQNPNDFD